MGTIRLYLYAGLAVVVGSLLLGITYYRDKAEMIQSQFDKFKAEQTALAAQQKSVNQAKEIQYANAIQNALAERDAAYRSLRHYTASAGSERVPGSPQTAGSPQTVCWDTARFAAALRDLEGILVEGQEAVVDDRAWLKSWPR